MHMHSQGPLESVILSTSFSSNENIDNTWFPFMWRKLIVMCLLFTRRGQEKDQKDSHKSGKVSSSKSGEASSSKSWKDACALLVRTWDILHSSRAACTMNEKWCAICNTKTHNIVQGYYTMDATNECVVLILLAFKGRVGAYGIIHVIS